MVPRTLAALVALLLLPAAAHAFPSTWYVAKGGSNGNACADSAHPCLTIGGAVTKAASGDTINIGAGTFGESVNAGGKVLTFNGVGSDASTGTIVDGHGNGSAFILSNGGTLNALRATEDSAATVSASSGGSSQMLTVTNAVIIADGLQSPIDATTAGGSLQIFITDSALQQVHTGSTGGSPQALELSGGAAASIVRSALSSGISSAVSSFAGSNVTASDSTFTGTQGILATNAILHVYRCRVTATSGNAVSLFGSSAAGTDPSTLIEDSLMKGSTGGVVLSLNEATRASTTTLHDSTIVATGAGAVAAVSTNIINGVSSATTLDGTVVRAQSTDGGTTRDLYANGNHASISASYSAFSTAVATGLATATAPGSGSNISGDPLFTDAANGDFSLQQSSPLVDRGDQAGLAVDEKDVTGGPRVLDGNGDGSAVVDIGAFEHAYVPPVQGGGGGSGGGGGGTSPPPASADTTAPALTNVKLGNGRVRFALSEAAKVTVTITKRRGSKHRRVRRFTVTGKAGANSAHFKKLRPGTYRVTLRATDAAGNRSKAFTRALKVKRRRH
jgi:hypothetical protein